jgi:hypothetical protein
VRVVDPGYENVADGVIHRGSTRTPAPQHLPAAMAARCAGPAVRAHYGIFPPGGTPGGITHDFQTEDHIIVCGGATLVTDGYIVNRRQGAPNGPTCGGMGYDVKKVTVKVGDVAIIALGVVHG